MSSPGVVQSWHYDTRGRVTTAISNISGLSGDRSSQTTYDAADRVKTLTYPSGEQVTYTYDAGGRQASLYSNTYGVYYANSATFDALDQPTRWTLGNGLLHTWAYYQATRRVYEIKLGTGTANDAALGAHIWNRYHYDAVGNVEKISDITSAGVDRDTQTFSYDHRDRLTSAVGDGVTGGPSSYADTLTYNAIGNITSKNGDTYTYPTSGVRPHAVTCADWTASPTPGSCAANAAYAYDANGNATSGGGRTLSWSAENQPLSVTQSGVSESYLYNADNERVKLTTTLPTTTTTTFYFGGMAEETLAGTKSTKRHVYTFNGQVIAQRDVFPNTTPSTFRYLHGDHLGGIVATSTSTASPTVTRQYFTAWGDARIATIARRWTIWSISS